MISFREKNTVSAAQKPERILFLDNIRAVAIIMVIGVHSLAYSVPLAGIQKEIIQFIVHTIAVPIFFFVDGYLFAQQVIQKNTFNYSHYIRKSIFRLLVPWIFFILFYTIFRYFFEILDFLNDKLIVGHSLQEVAISSYGSVIAPQMYFLLSLFLIRLCCPIFRRIIFIKNYLVLLLVFFCYYLVYKSSISLISPYLKIEGGTEPVLHAIWGIQYYFAGIVFFKCSQFFNLKKVFILFLFIFIIVLPLKSELGSLWFVLSQYSYLITLFIFFIFMGDRFKFLGIVGKNTMGIYLVHAPVLLKGISLFLNKFITIPLYSYIAILFCTFSFSLLLCRALDDIPYATCMFGTAYRRKS